MNLDAEGNINDAGAGAKGNGGEDDDGDQYYEDNQDAKERMTKLKNNINRYYQQAQGL